MRTIVVAPDRIDPAVLADAAAVLRAGGVVAYPTDTLYGLAVDPRSEAGVMRLFDVKGREASVAVPLIASDLEQARTVGRFGPSELRLAETFWPGPLTIVLPAAVHVAAQLRAGRPTIAVRVPDHPVARAVAAALGSCITATSANLSGQRPASRVAEISPALAARLDLVLDAGPAPGGAPSTLVEITGEGPRLVRAGAIAWERVLESLQ